MVTAEAQETKKICSAAGAEAVLVSAVPKG
jgi:hypothetical protein